MPAPNFHQICLVMMNNSNGRDGMKKNIPIVSLCIIGVIAFLCLLKIIYVGFEIKDRMDAGIPKECEYKPLMDTLEKYYSIDFPNHVSDARAAWSPRIEGVENYLLRFRCDKNDYNEFISKHPQKIEVFPYEKDNDIRYASAVSKNPWFLVPITQGFHLEIKNDIGIMSIEVDSSSGSNYVFYVHGTMWVSLYSK